MKLLLKEFQSDRVEDLVRRLRQASRESRGGDLQAVSLSSPTGSGKTVMATAAIETLLTGDGNVPPIEDVTFLWITDQPELNEQTRRKMFEASSVLGPGDLVVIDTAFDQPTFTPGTVYFLNTQKLSRTSLLVTGAGDRREHTIWDTIRNTVADRPDRFFVFIDEAHRGMGEGRGRNEANTIIQKFIKGSQGEIPPIPLIAGISATPERFHALIQGTLRTERRVVVEPADVRNSGLLKERITLFHPTEAQPSDMTMLRAATRAWQEFSEQWAGYSESQGAEAVQPVLVVQVQDGTGRQVSRTDLAAALRNIEDEAGVLPDEAYAHAFQEGIALAIGERKLRYLAPSNIDDDPDVQVVFFKTSLNTGWDCPRAEVMMSFRTALDDTLIAQLVGRMVRTPLARRVDAVEFLNTVSLYLPHYDAEGLRRVVTRLTTPDPDNMPSVDVEMGEDVLTLRRAPLVDDAFAVLESLPSYIVPRPKKTSEVRRLMKLARLLSNDGLVSTAPEQATAALLKALRDEYERVKETEQFKTIVVEKGKLDVRVVDWQLHGDMSDEEEVIQLNVAAENVDDLFEAAGRRLGEGLHKAWWRARVREDEGAITAAKLELFALCLEGGAGRRVETAAQQLVQEWLRQHQPAIGALSEASRQAYSDIRRQAADPELAPLQYPASIEVRKADATWVDHLYVDEKNMFPAKLNRWETRVMDEELRREGFVGWLRNTPRKSWALTVPYQMGGQSLPLYPDFLVVRKRGEHLVVDIIDPHATSYADAPAKAAGLAQYAAKHGHLFGRIELIIINGDEMRRLDLTDEQIRNQVKLITTVDQLKALFQAAG